MVNSMVSNMAVGPVMVGGNEVSVTPKGKVRVVNGNGKVLTLSQDQFQKQTLKNLDRLENGENIEYKKDNKALKIIGATVAVAGLTLAIINRKKIANYLKNFSFKKLWTDMKGLFKKNNKTVRTIYSTETAAGKGSLAAATAAETRAAKTEGIVENTNKLVNDFLESKARTRGKAHKARLAELEAAFAAFPEGSKLASRAEVLASMGK